MSPTRNSPALQYRRRKHIGELLYIAHVLRSAWEHTLRTKQEKSSLFSVSIPGFSISRFAPRVSGGAGRRDSTWKQTWAMFSLVRGPVGQIMLCCCCCCCCCYCCCEPRLPRPSSYHLVSSHGRRTRATRETSLFGLNIPILMVPCVRDRGTRHKQTRLVRPLLKVDVVGVQVVADVTALPRPGAESVQLMLRKKKPQNTHTKDESKTRNTKKKKK